MANAFSLGKNKKKPGPISPRPAAALCYLYLCVVFEKGALKINTCACVVLVLCGAKFDSDDFCFV